MTFALASASCALVRAYYSTYVLVELAAEGFKERAKERIQVAAVVQ